MKYLSLFLFCTFVFIVTMLCSFNFKLAKESVADAADCVFGRGDYANKPRGSF